MPRPLRMLAIFGTRPEAIKMAPVVKALRARSECAHVDICATAQHRALLDQVLQLFAIRPDFDLDLMQPNQTPSQITARVLDKLQPILDAGNYDWVLVQGDTTTVMASTIAAHHSRIKVAHVEAGLRTGDKWSPFPEEMNRVVADHLSDLCFAPTERARQNLLREGIPDNIILVTGNTVVDALHQIASLPWAPAPDNPLYGLPNEARLVLVTAHRRESFGQPLRNICVALRTLARRGRGRVVIIYPVHPNPNVRSAVNGLLADVPEITLVEPLDYLSFVKVMQRSYLVLTDSGGIQEEAPSLGVPVLVMRDVTERPEAVEAGVARLVGTDAAYIVDQAWGLLCDPEARAAMARAVNPYGDGAAAGRIAGALLETVTGHAQPGARTVDRQPA